MSIRGMTPDAYDAVDTHSERDAGRATLGNQAIRTTRQGDMSEALQGVERVHENLSMLEEKMAFLHGRLYGSEPESDFPANATPTPGGEMPELLHSQECCVKRLQQLRENLDRLVGQLVG